MLDDVLALALSVRKRCEYKLPGGVEVLKVSEISPELEPTPSVPYVRYMFCHPLYTDTDAFAQRQWGLDRPAFTWLLVSSK